MTYDDDPSGWQLSLLFALLTLMYAYYISI